MKRYSRALDYSMLLKGSLMVVWHHLILLNHSIMGDKMQSKEYSAVYKSLVNSSVALVIGKSVLSLDLGMKSQHNLLQICLGLESSNQQIKDQREGSQSFGLMPNQKRFYVTKVLRAEAEIHVMMILILQC